MFMERWLERSTGAPHHRGRGARSMTTVVVIVVVVVIAIVFRRSRACESLGRRNEHWNAAPGQAARPALHGGERAGP